MQSEYHPQQAVYMVTMLYRRPCWLNSTVVHPSVHIVICARKRPTCFNVWILTQPSNSKTEPEDCVLDLSHPDMNNEELEPVPEALALQMVPLLMGVAGSW